LISSSNLDPLNPTLEQRLATHVTSLHYQGLTPHTIERTKTFVADTLSVGMAGTSVPQAELLLKTLRANDPNGCVGVWGHGLRLSASNAIMVNAFNVHCQEYDCVHEGAVVHAMATLLPVLMAHVQTAGPVSGQALITAVVAGIDIACTLGMAGTGGMHFFRPATAGGFGAVAGLAHLRGLTVDELIAAWGFQLAQTSGTMQGHREGSPVLPLQVSFNARAAWQSCDLAQSGLGSLEQPLSGECGYLAMFERGHRTDHLLDELELCSRIDEFSHKPYPSGRATHGGIEGLLNIMEKHQLDADSIESVHVQGPPLVNRLVNRAPLPQPTPNYARLCMPFVLAKVMQHGQLLPSHYRGSDLNDARTYELAQRVSMSIDDNPDQYVDPNAFTPVTVRIHLKNGQCLETTIESMLASESRPLNLQQRRDKFEQCCALAVHKPGCSSALWRELERLEEQHDVNEVLTLITQ
jgi:2-methylcitrate dehydratase PrpD